MAPALQELFHNQDLTRHFLNNFMKESSSINLHQIAKHTDSDSNLLMFRCKIFIPETKNLFHNKLIILSKRFKLHNVIVRNIAWMTDTFVSFNDTLHKVSSFTILYSPYKSWTAWYQNQGSTVGKLPRLRFLGFRCWMSINEPQLWTVGLGLK